MSVVDEAIVVARVPAQWLSAPARLVKQRQASRSGSGVKRGARVDALSPRRRAAYALITALLPLLLLAAIEGVLRLACSDCGLPAFVRAPFGDGAYEIANPRVGERWFPGLDAPPEPQSEPLALRKPDHGFRVFVLGESSTAGFPYPRNVTFSRMLRDMLADVLPDDSVEVVNLGIAATNSFTMLDLAGAVAERQPDAVLIYAGHNEYYGALGVAARERAFGVPIGAARAYLALMRLRLVIAVRDGALALLRGRDGAPAGDERVASLMELLGRDQEYPLGSEGYDEGIRQFERNLGALVGQLTEQGIPVLIGSVASNLRDHPPFAVAANGIPGGAADAFRAAREALEAGDITGARAGFDRARELDVVRFRAPAAFNDVIRRVADRQGGTYAPVAEAFRRESRDGIPGSELFLEHVHPTREGHALIARTFLETLLEGGVLGARARPDRLATPSVYRERQALTALDERIATHTVRTLGSRWPFVPREAQSDYRGTYRPTGVLDSLAFAVSRGASWADAKLALAADYERRGHPDSAAAEYAGLARDAPLFDEPLILQGRALTEAGDLDEAERVLSTARRMRESAAVLLALAELALERDLRADAIALLERALVVQPDHPGALYQLSLAYGLERDLANARATATRLARVAPAHPGLAEWLRLLGLRR